MLQECSKARRTPRFFAGYVRMILAIEFLSAAILVVEVALVLLGVVTRYFFHYPLVWVDEVISASFLWLIMLGAAVALARGEHLRLTTIVSKFSRETKMLCETLSIGVALLFLIALWIPSFDYSVEEIDITTAALGISNAWRTSGIWVGISLMLTIALYRMLTETSSGRVFAVLAILVTASMTIWLLKPIILTIGNYNLLVFFCGIVGTCVVVGVPIGFAFGIATVAYLSTTTHVPLMVIVSRLDEGVSNVILLAVPAFVLLGMLIEITGMARAMMGFLFALLAHVRGGLSYVLLAAMYVISGISGSKAADMAAVAPVLFPEMKKWGVPEGEMGALLSASAAMSETIPPSLVLIAIGSVTSVSIAALFTGGLLPALVLALALAFLCRLRASSDRTERPQRASLSAVAYTFVVGLPALALPFVMRVSIVEGIATATEVSTIGIAYVVLVGLIVYRKFDYRRLFPILVDTAVLSGAVLFIIGSATAMGWALTQSGFSRQLVQVMTNLPGGAPVFLASSIVAFIILGSLLEGIPAVVLFGPMLFPVAKAVGIHEVHYAMVAILAMGIGLFAPPFGIGFYAACAIGKVDANEAMRCVWPYLGALFIGLIVVAAFPWLSIGLLPTGVR